ncbi:MAG: branched-chain amino acid ABC transporter permease [Anaerolineae bacterium]|nr:branched-chain amino acid ABC transporter permease [Anaerolineae bacterium]MDW8101918.1 branched-chain amino acid ABC transporter permease [Anaerolineae bacterium]
MRGTLRRWLKLLETWRGSLVLLILLLSFPFIGGLILGEPASVSPQLRGISRVLALAETGEAKFWQGMIIQMLILGVFAMSYDLLLGYTGIISFGHAMFYGTGGYVVGLLVKHARWSVWEAMAMVVLVALLQSFVIGVLSLRVRGVYLAMVTLAFAEFFYILAEATDFRHYTGADDGLHGIYPPPFLSPTTNRTNFYFFTLAFFIVMYLVAHRLVNSPTGRVMIAIRENEARTAMLGYNTFVYKLIAIMASGVMASLAGSFNALFNLGVTPSVLSVGTTIEVIAMTIVGGVGTLSGPVLGAAIVHLLGYWLNRLLGPAWVLAFGVAFVLIVIFLPYGIVGTWRTRSFQWKATWQRYLRMVASRISLKM